MYSILKMVIFHCYVWLPEGTYGQITVIPKPECSGDLGGIPLINHHLGWPRRVGRYNLPRCITVGREWKNTCIYLSIYSITYIFAPKSWGGQGHWRFSTPSALQAFGPTQSPNYFRSFWVTMAMEKNRRLASNPLRRVFFCSQEAAQWRLSCNMFGCGKMTSHWLMTHRNFLFASSHLLFFFGSLESNCPYHFQIIWTTFSIYISIYRSLGVFYFYFISGKKLCVLVLFCGVLKNEIRLTNDFFHIPSTADLDIWNICAIRWSWNLPNRRLEILREQVARERCERHSVAGSNLEIAMKIHQLTSDKLFHGSMSLPAYLDIAQFNCWCEMKKTDVDSCSPYQSK